MWDLPRPGLEPVSPALAGGSLTTAPPRKPQANYFILGSNQISPTELTKLYYSKMHSSQTEGLGRSWQTMYLQGWFTDITICEGSLEVWGHQGQARGEGCYYLRSPCEYFIGNQESRHKIGNDVDKALIG